MSAPTPAEAVAANLMRAKADLASIARIVAAFESRPPQHVTWATAADTARLASMTRDVIDVFGDEVTR